MDRADIRLRSGSTRLTTNDTTDDIIDYLLARHKQLGEGACLSEFVCELFEWIEVMTDSCDATFIEVCLAERLVMADNKILFYRIAKRVRLDNFNMTDQYWENRTRYLSVENLKKARNVYVTSSDYSIAKWVA